MTKLPVEGFFKKYLDNWLPLCPDANKILTLLSEKNENIVNDHIALRTMDFSEIGLQKLAQPFLEMGYEYKGEYHFKQKKLYAKHLELPSNPNATKVFISELLTAQISTEAKTILQSSTSNIPLDAISHTELGTSGRHWDFDENTYHNLYKESEYAAWFYAFGFRANHFTISINHLNSFDSLSDFNVWLKEHGITLNQSGGEIKGSKDVGLIQSSTMANSVHVEGNSQIPGCYIEFAERFAVGDQKLYQGFVTSSADKIFESTSKTT